MSNRTLVEMNHDYCPREEELLEWARKMRLYMSSGDSKYLPYGVRFIYRRHHHDVYPADIAMRLPQ